ncbi:hypothetical protein FGG69_gp21 [Salinibacter phage SRUTV-1]|uniref:Uncharacterized protein n=1 Tax=Salinibacter phage SRUTV-1 TaxID=2684227 RepID=A0A2D3FAH6_9CAUD|nr:hypothetical protein FGG69_gp21 [Salinibacter phage SRUTV-1]ATU47014.1 hypothetical protein [Salinibacter phage SRUTV-1]AUO79355.1 hypothetical protein [Salinibacter virus M31CR41-3]
MTMLRDDPKTYYPNTVADVLVEALRDHPDVMMEAYHYGQELFRENDGLEVHPQAYDTTGAFINCVGTDTVGSRDARKDGVIDEVWRGRARVAHHNPKDGAEKGQEAIVYAKRLQAHIQGTKIPTTTEGVEGGPRIVYTETIEEVLNIVDFAVYRIPFEIELQHDLSTDLNQT